MVVPPTVVLAQLDFSTPNIPQLPSPPLLERILLDNPWPLVIVLGVAAIVIFVMLNGRGKLRAGLVAAGTLLLAAGGAYLTSVLVTTPREQIKQATRELIDATADVQLGRLEHLLDDDLVIRVFGVPRDAGKTGTLSAVDRRLGGQYVVREHSIQQMHATIDGPRVGRTHVRVHVGSDMGALSSWWRVDWERGPDDIWRARRIEALWIPGIPNPGG